jgi:hypothetical protein
VWYKGFLYQAASWKTARRVVAKVEFHAGELFPRLGFIVTNLETPSRAVVGEEEHCKNRAQNGAVPARARADGRQLGILR